MSQLVFQGGLAEGSWPSRSRYIGRHGDIGHHQVAEGHDGSGPGCRAEPASSGITSPPTLASPWNMGRNRRLISSLVRPPDSAACCNRRARFGLAWCWRTIVQPLEQPLVGHPGPGPAPQAGQKVTSRRPAPPQASLLRKWLYRLGGLIPTRSATSPRRWRCSPFLREQVLRGIQDAFRGARLRCAGNAWLVMGLRSILPDTGWPGPSIPQARGQA